MIRSLSHSPQLARHRSILAAAVLVSINAADKSGSPAFAKVTSETDGEVQPAHHVAAKKADERAINEGFGPGIATSDAPGHGSDPKPIASLAAAKKPDVQAGDVRPWHMPAIDAVDLGLDKKHHRRVGITLQ